MTTLNIAVNHDEFDAVLHALDRQIDRLEALRRDINPKNTNDYGRLTTERVTYLRDLITKLKQNA